MHTQIFAMAHGMAPAMVAGMETIILAITKIGAVTRASATAEHGMPLWQGTVYSGAFQFIDALEDAIAWARARGCAVARLDCRVIGDAPQVDGEHRAAICCDCLHVSSWVRSRGEVLRDTFYQLCDDCGHVTRHRDHGTAELGACKDYLDSILPIDPRD